MFGANVVGHCSAALAVERANPVEQWSASNSPDGAVDHLGVVCRPRIAPTIAHMVRVWSSAGKRARRNLQQDEPAVELKLTMERWNGSGPNTPNAQFQIRAPPPR